MKKIFKALLIVSMIFLHQYAFSQKVIDYKRSMSPLDSVMFATLPRLYLTDHYKDKTIPLLEYSLDNSDLPFFRPVFFQYGWSCGQASTIGYALTYELNRLRNLSGTMPENQCTPMHNFGFFNNGEYPVGVNYLYTFNAIRHNGNADVAGYGGMGNDYKTWISGYDIWYNGMSNKIDKVYSIYVGDEEGLLTLKHWLNDHLDGSQYGSLANFYTELNGYTVLPPGTPDAGKAVITGFGDYTGHSMTFIGWNDSVRYDYNNDGQYTNDIDINGDGIVNMKDWEIGAMRLVNSWGTNWADSGYCYVMYKVLAEEKPGPGIWNKSVTVFDVKDGYEPLLTYKITLKHTSRNKIKVMAGVATDTTLETPEHTMDFPIFNYQGGAFYMQGGDSEEDKTIEFGLDVTPLLSYVEAGQPARFFLQVRENDPFDMDDGEIVSFSLMDYTSGMVAELPCDATYIPLLNNWLTQVSVVHSVLFDKVVIDTEEIPPYVPGQPYSVQMEASGGTPPYDWKVVLDYDNFRLPDTYPSVTGTKLPLTGGVYAVKTLDFDFPFYGHPFDTLVIHQNGMVIFREAYFPVPYQNDDMFVFQYEKMIAPFYNKDFKIPASQEKGVWYEGDETHATFRVKAVYDEDGSTVDIDYTFTLFPDGTIECYYPDMDFGSLPQWITGVSYGDGKSFTVSDFSYVPLKTPGEKVVFQCALIPDSISIDNNGLLTIGADNSSDIMDFSICVSDADNISFTREFNHSFSFLYSVVSGNDNQLEYGESATVTVVLKNNTSGTLHNVEINSHCYGEYIMLTDSVVTVGDLEAGDTVTLENAISFDISPETPDMYNVNIIVNVTSGEYNRSFLVNDPVKAPVLLRGEIYVDDGDNGILDPGETTDIIINVINAGHTAAGNVEGLVNALSPSVTINSGILNFGTLLPGQGAVVPLNVTVDENALTGTTAEFLLNITSAYPVPLYDTFSLKVGYPLVTIADLDPEHFSGPVLDSLIQLFGLSCKYLDSIPSDFTEVTNLMVLLGRQYSNHVLTEEEGDRLAGFLADSGNIYMEGGKTWYGDPQTAAQPLFNVSAVYYAWHLYSTVSGVQGTFTNGMQFGYESLFGLYNYYLVPEENAFTILTDTTGENGFMIANETPGYKTVASTIDFAGLVDGEFPSTKKNLLANILMFFGITDLPVSTDEQFTPGNSELICFPNPVCNSAVFTINGKTGDKSFFALYDINGTTVIKTKLTPGKSNFIIEMKDEYGNPLHNGIYFGKYFSGNTFSTIKIIVLKQ